MAENLSASAGRLTPMSSPFSPAHFDDLHEFVQIHVAAGYLSVAAIVDEAVEIFSDLVVDPASARAAATAVADQAVVAHRAAEASWSPVTDCDRLDAAFTELDDAGVLARQHYRCCATCGTQDILDELQLAEKAGRPARGYTFFHVQDTEHAVSGEALYLSYGAGESGNPDAAAIGHEVVDTLRRHGLSPAWNGKVAHRICLPLEWQRRRG
jgi:hypothetical protein